MMQIIQSESRRIDAIFSEISKVIVGQKKLVERLLTAIFTGGHILLEGVPGLAKTLAIKTFADIIDLQFSRIQFTPDLLPADITGTMIYNPQSLTFSIKHGPIFANIVLADEINRAPAKVQSALLEAMQEKQVTIGDKTYKLPEPFIVLATQNPLEQEGTYPLSEAQTDRFMLKTLVAYPSRVEEREIMRQASASYQHIMNKILDANTILKLREIIKLIYLDEKIENYILDIIFATRNPAEYNMPSLSNLIHIGASPRATISLACAARAVAFLSRRDYVVPADVRNIAPDILRHRIGITFEAEAEAITADNIINEVLNAIPPP